MSGLFTSLEGSSEALAAFERALEVTQNNVNNASTPGYARQQMTLVAMPFEPALGLPGGVMPGDVVSTRDRYADEQVRRQSQSFGFFDQKVSSLSRIEGEFDISGKSGIPAALNQLFQQFSAWSASPNDPSLRQNVLDGAGGVAQAFRQTAADLGRSTQDAGQQMQQVVAHINRLTAQLQSYNVERQQDPNPNAGLDAKVQSTLEELSSLVNFDALPQADGTVTVLLGGQTPLVIGNHQYAIRADLSQASGARILDTSGADITAQATDGSLGGLLAVRNQTLPSLSGDVDRLAQTFADRVNQLLTSGQYAAGQSGLPLFTYQQNGAGIAQSLAVNAALTPDKLAAIDPGPPSVANGTALKLAGLANSSNPADQIDGVSYMQFYGGLAARVGQQLSSATDSRQVQQQLVAQAQSMRDQISGVSLDQEAVHLIEFQRSYQATAKMVSVLSDLAQTVVNLVQ